MSVQLNGQSNIQRTQQLQKLLKSMPGAKGIKQTQKPGMGQNDSIFNLVSQNQTRANAAQSGLNINSNVKTNRATTTNNVVQANTDASVNDVQDKKVKINTNISKSNINSGEVPKEFQKVDVSDVDFSNLSGLSEPQLLSLRHDIKDILDNDCPFFLRAPFEGKLNRVESELRTRGEQDGDKFSDDNKKADEKSNESITKDAESGAKVAGSGAAAAQKATAETNKTSQQTVELQKNIDSKKAKLEKEQANATKTIQANVKATAKEVEKMEKIGAENEQISAEIDSINAEIEATKEQGGDDAQPKIEGLNAKVQSSSAKIAQNTATIGKSRVTIKKYSTANNKTIRTLNKSNKAYMKTVTSAQQQIQQNQQKNNSFMETMDKINDVSSKVALAGTVAKYTGMALSKIPWTSAVGIYMEATGTVAETVGNYGVAAANIGKTAGYAAEGNIMGAITSAGTAIMAGATAVKNTKQVAGIMKEGVGQAAEKAAEEAGKKAAEKAAQKGGEEAAQKAAEKASAKVTGSLLKDTLKDSAGNAMKDAAGNTIKEVSTKGIKGFANATALAAGRQSTTQILMGAGTALMNGASLFASKGDDTGAVTNPVRRGVAMRGQSRRRRV